MKILFPVECDRFGLDFAFFDIYFVAAEDDRHLLTYTDKIAFFRGLC